MAAVSQMIPTSTCLRNRTILSAYAVVLRPSSLVREVSGSAGFDLARILDARREADAGGLNRPTTLLGCCTLLPVRRRPSPPKSVAPPSLPAPPAVGGG